MCVMFLLVVGQESSFASWISSYAVLKGFSTKEGATVYSSIYWIAITVSRFILPFIEGKSSKKLFFLYTMAIFSSILSLIFVYGLNPKVGMTLGAFLMGISNSVIFPQTLTLPK